jgi:hypothetical protein
VNAPFATIHFAGPPLTLSHPDSDLPSKRTTASAGACAGVAPGLTSFGTGSQTSVASGFGPDSANAAALAINATAMATHLFIVIARGNGRRRVCTPSPTTVKGPQSEEGSLAKIAKIAKVRARVEISRGQSTFSYLFLYFSRPELITETTEMHVFLWSLCALW